MKKLLPISAVLSLFLLAAPVLAVNNPANMRACRAREGAISERVTSLVDLVNVMVSKFDAIAQRVEDYYTNKAVPAGKIVANYTALVADIQAKKTVVQTDLARAQTDAGSFSCTTDNPKTALTQFRTDMQTVKSALQDYRTAIKNLIVAVRSNDNK